MKIDTKDILNLIEVNCCNSCKSGCNATCKGCNARKIMDLIEDLDTDCDYNTDIKNGQEINKIEIDAKSLGCPCYNCFNFNEKFQRCKAIQRDCISYCNWYSNTFKN